MALRYSPANAAPRQVWRGAGGLVLC